MLEDAVALTAVNDHGINTCYNDGLIQAYLSVKTVGDCGCVSKQGWPDLKKVELVVEPTPLKHISQNGNLPQIGVKIKKNETTTQKYICFLLDSNHFYGLYGFHVPFNWRHRFNPLTQHQKPGSKERPISNGELNRLPLPWK